jgi:hypothetical protein
VQLGDGGVGTSGIIINKSDTLGLDILDSEVVGGTCGTAGRSGMS